MPNLNPHADEDRIGSILRPLGISPEHLEGRALPRYEQAQELIAAETDGRGREHRLIPPAAAAWRALKGAARSQGVTLLIASAFRSVDRQAEIIRAKLEAGVPLTRILALNAPPGYSEHHTGRAVDVTTPGMRALAPEFEQTEAFRWLSANANVFRYFLSYPPGNPQGFVYEPWHWCYRDG